VTTRFSLYPNPHVGNEPTGYCALVQTWGSDEEIVASARMSTDGAFRGWGTPDKPGDEKLLRYMHENRHDSPFEFAGASVEFQVPIFVIRQVHRHRAAGYSELSGRYTEMPDLFWLPQPGEVRRQGGSNRQGSVADDSPEWAAVQADAVEMMSGAYDHAVSTYELLVKMGVAREQARAVLPLAQMTRCRMTTNLRMWLHFLGLRLDPHAQVETRQLAEAIAALLRPVFPRTVALFDEGRPR